MSAAGGAVCGSAGSAAASVTSTAGGAIGSVLCGADACAGIDSWGDVASFSEQPAPSSRSAGISACAVSLPYRDIYVTIKITSVMIGLVSRYYAVYVKPLK
jgi:hypothetical protein